jgi:TolB-like protein/Tfp pilus assembly protein PilF
MSIIAELKRRNVIRVAVAYVITAWLILQVTDVVIGNIEAPPWVFQAILLVVVIGFPLAMLFAWAFELTPDGLKRESEVDRTASVADQTGRKLDRAIIAVLVVAVVYFAYDKFSAEPVVDDIVAVDTTTEKIADALTDNKPSIAVLPFVNMSSDPEQDYFSDGIAEELLNLLAKIPQFQVAGRTSSFAFKGENDDLRLIGNSLGVNNILEGSVRKGGDRVRITAQLVRVDNGFHLWSETYDRELNDVFAVQDEIATAVVYELKVKLLGFDVTSGAGDPLYANADAHNSYLQGLFYLNKVGPDNYDKAATYFQEAVALVPESALAWASLAAAHIRFAGQSDKDPAETLARAREEIAKAFSLDDKTPEAYLAKADLADSFDWNWAAADDAIRQALVLRPGDAAALRMRASLAGKLGRNEESLREYRELLVRDPFDGRVPYGMVSQLYIAGEYDEAESILQRVLDRDPTGNFTNAYMSFVLAGTGRLEEALAFAQKEPVDFVRLNAIAVVQFKLGNIEASDRAQQELLEQYGDLASYQQASIFAARLDADTTMEWLERAYKVRDPGLAEVKTDPDYVFLHDDPRFRGLLKKMNLSD